MRKETGVILNLSHLFYSYCIPVIECIVKYVYLENQLRRGKAENVCCSQEETPAVLLEGQRVP